jgi:hypothetical protein
LKIFNKIEDLLFIGGQNPLTSKEKNIKQAISPNLLSLFFTDRFVSLSGKTNVLEDKRV